MRVSRLRSGVFLGAAVMLVAASCGDDGGGEGFCGEVRSTLASAGSTMREGSEADGLGHLRDMFVGLSELQPPTEISDDWDAAVGTAAEQYDAFLEMNRQLAEVGPLGPEDDPADVLDAELEERMGAIELDGDEQIRAADDRVNDYLDENCGITLR